METKEIFYGSAAIAFIIGVILLSGCIGTQKVINPNGGSATISNSNSYLASPDLPITDKYSKQADSLIRPILIKVFGGAKVKSTLVNGNSHSVVYILPRKITVNDYTPIINKLQDLNGWNITMKNANDKSLLIVINSNETSIAISFNVGGNTAGVSIVS